MAHGRAPATDATITDNSIAGLNLSHNDEIVPCRQSRDNDRSHTLALEHENTHAWPQASSHTPAHTNLEGTASLSTARMTMGGKIKTGAGITARVTAP